MAVPSPGLLSRGDKWYLGAGDGLVWAPPFPLWHETPGFWDEAHLLQYPVGPLFTVSVLPAGPPLRAEEFDWSPAGLRLRYHMAPRLQAVERRSAPGDRILASEWQFTWKGARARTLDLVLWTAVDGELVAEDGVEEEKSGLVLRRRARDRKGQELALRLTYRITGGHQSWGAYRSEPSAPIPDYRLTPFYDREAGEPPLRNEARLGGIDARGLVYVGLHRRLNLRAGRSARLAAAVEITPEDLPVPRNTTPARAMSRGAATRAEQSWKSFCGEVPRFSCSDERWERYWWYRWYGLRLNGVPAGLGQYRAPSVCEGIGYFHQPISYSAMCHAREVRWHADPAWARGVIDTFFDRQREDGSVPGRVYLDHLQEADFYHADWGRAVADVDRVAPDAGWLATLRPRLARYGEWLAGTRDSGRTGMIDVTDQYETGQEYMSRYQAVDPEADRHGWEHRLRLKGIDVTVYAYRLFRLLERTGTDAAERAGWRERAERTRTAVRDQMWDDEAGMFSDVDPASGRRTGVKAAVCFYPYLTDLVDERHLGGLERHLFNPDEFWTPYPVPSSSREDPRFSPDAEWNGKRHACPWNGRVWPMTNSHMVDAVARAVRHGRPRWASKLAHLLERFISMMSFEGDAERPNCFEHYHPLTGRASVYRGIDDYQHSWVNDLLLRHAAGVLPRGAEGVTIQPIPLGRTVEVSGLLLAGHQVEVRVMDGDRGTADVRVDGHAAGRATFDQPLEIAW